MSIKQTLIEKYTPTDLSEVIGNKKNIESLLWWLREFKNKKAEKKGILISGPSGIGKTIIAKLALQKWNYRVIEFNAGDVRSQKSLKEKIDKIMKFKSVSVITSKIDNPPGIIMDEIEGMGSSDKGGFQEIVKIINPLRGKRSIKKIDRENYNNTWTLPIICICNNNFDKKINELKKDCLDVRLDYVSKSELNDFISKIIKNEKIKIKENHKELIIKSTYSDIRKILHILDDLRNIYGTKEITDENLNNTLIAFKRNTIDMDLFDTTKKILDEDVNINKGLILFDTERCLLPLMVHENYPSVINMRDNTYEDKTDKMCKVIDILCCADALDKHIYTNQSWENQDMHGIASCILPSQYINMLKKKKYSNATLNFTNILGKTSLQYANNKNLETTICKIEEPNLKIEDIFFLSRKIIVLYKKGDKESLEKINEILENNNLRVEDIEKLVKINKINDNSLYINKIKGLLKKLDSK